VGASGTGAQYIQAVHLYGDLDLDGALFESNELMMSNVLTNGIASLGSLEAILIFPDGTMAIIPDGGGFMPRLMYVTVDISDIVQPSSVRLQVAIDVAALTGFPSSRLMNTTPAEWTFQITGSGGGGGGGGGGGTLKSYDMNNNNLLDDPEFFNIIDAWIASIIGDQMFFVAVDVWVSQSPVMAASVEREVLKFSSLEVTPSRHAMTFTAQGQGIASLGVEVFDLKGERVFADTTYGTRVTWRLTAPTSRPVANGIYLYVITAHGVDGAVLRSEVKKLVVMR
jgi:hypothetical protein